MSGMIREAERREREVGRVGLRGRRRGGTFVPLSYVDDVNSVKRWKEAEASYLGVNMRSRRKHQAYRTAKGKAAWELVRRLTKLPPKGKKQIVCGQLLPILTYGAELHTEPSEVMERLSAEWGRWICGGWRGSARTKIEDITGIPDLKTWMWTKRIRWAALVYGRALPALRETAEGILEGVLEPDAVLHWMSGGDETVGREVDIAELDAGEVTAWSDGSRQEGVAAVAAVGGEAGEEWEGVYLGSLATVMDAEMLGVVRAWQAGRSTVALDSQGAIRRLQNLRFEQPRSWIEELAVGEMVKGHKTVMWVKGHSGVEGNERADRKAKEVAWVGRRMLRPDVITPAGIRQAFPMGRPSKQTKWNREALRGLTYMVTDRGPQRWWLHKVGRADDSSFGLCGEGVAQNAAHLLSCPGVADGKGRDGSRYGRTRSGARSWRRQSGGDWGSDNGVVVADFWGITKELLALCEYNMNPALSPELQGKDAGELELLAMRVNLGVKRSTFAASYVSLSRPQIFALTLDDSMPTVHGPSAYVRGSGDGEESSAVFGVGGDQRTNVGGATGDH
ncbi:hypothetical protein EV426DRAFT_721797 [Tirmania nivea]|nr:hypothetical protein EV426DRAFT_721797 [Tirmania nivea]